VLGVFALCVCGPPLLCRLRQVVLSTGEVITVSTRERPKLLFSAEGQMTHLLNGARLPRSWLAAGLVWLADCGPRRCAFCWGGNLRDPPPWTCSPSFAGVCSAPACPSGPPTGCVDCKYSFWDFTLVAPLVV
jgi:hypothetical protein